MECLRKTVYLLKHHCSSFQTLCIEKCIVTGWIMIQTISLEIPFKFLCQNLHIECGNPPPDVLLSFLQNAFIICCCRSEMLTVENVQIDAVALISTLSCSQALHFSSLLIKKRGQNLVKISPSLNFRLFCIVSFEDSLKWGGSGKKRAI